MNGPAAAEPNDGHLATDHLLGNLKGRALASTFVTLSSQGVKFAATVASTIALARLLAPGDFGLVAMVASVTGFLRVFKDAGLSAATVQRADITHAQVSNLFWINVAVSGVLAGALVALAPAVAWFYHEPRLVSIVVATSVTFLLSGSSVQHLAILSRQMRFKAIAVIEISSIIAGVAVACSMAVYGWGYWSLVGMSIAQEATTTGGAWYFSRWRPQLPVRGRGTWPLIKFGANLSAASLIYCVVLNVDTLLIGRLYGAASAGIYTRAMALFMQPLGQFLSPISKVFEPTLARLQNDSERYRRVFLSVFESIALVGFVATAILLPLSLPVTLVLLGSKWVQSAYVFAGFTGVAIVSPLSTAVGWLLNSQGRGRDALIVSAVNAPIMIAGIVIGVRYGPFGVALGWSAAGLLAALPFAFYRVGREGPVRSGDLWRSFLKHLPIWLIVFVPTLAVRLSVSEWHPVFQLAVGTLAGGFAAIAGVVGIKPSRQVAILALRAARELVNQRRTGSCPPSSHAIARSD